MKINKTLTLILISITLINLTSCTRLLQLKRNLSEEVISNIKSNPLSVSYSVNSELPDILQKDNLEIRFNDTIKSNIDEYMRNKFSNLKSIQNEGYFIVFEIKNIALNKNYNPDFASAIGGAIVKQKDIMYGQAEFFCKITFNVKLYQNNKLLLDKEIVSDSSFPTVVKEYNVSSYTYESYQKVIDIGVSKSLVLINKYFSSINI